MKITSAGRPHCKNLLTNHSAALMQPLHYDSRDPAAQDNSITHAAATPSNLDAANTMRSAETELQNAIELRATASEIAAHNRISTPKQKKDDCEALFKRIFKRKIASAKIAKICWQITVAAWLQPLQYDLRSSAAKDNSITDVDAASTMRFAASRRKPARIYAHGNTRWQQSCSHSNAICHHRFKKRIELRTQTQPLVQNTEEEPIRDRNDRSRNRRTREVPFIAGCSHFTR